MHGRNYDTWNIKGASAASDRFNYDYSQLELEGLAVDILRLSGRVADLDVIFNNNKEDQGQRNAQTLIDILGARRSSRHLSSATRNCPSELYGRPGCCCAAPTCRQRYVQASHASTVNRRPAVANGSRRVVGGIATV